MRSSKFIFISFVAVVLNHSTGLTAPSLFESTPHRWGGNETQAPKGFYLNIAAGNGEYLVEEKSGELQFRMSAKQPARIQLGTTIEEDRIKEFWGKKVRASVSVEGVLYHGTDGKPPAASLVLEFGSHGRGKRIEASAIIREDATNPESFIVEPQTLELVFRVPYETTRLAYLCYLMNSSGELKWTTIKLRQANDLELTTELPEKFQSLSEVNAEAALRFEQEFRQRREWLNTRITLPPRDELYKLNEERLNGPRPRFLLADHSPASLQKKLSDPRMKQIHEHFLHEMYRISALPLPDPKTIPLNAEDPLREYAENLISLSAGAVMAPDLEDRERFRQQAKAWADVLMKAGPPNQNLPLSQQIFAMCAVYDWLGDELSDEFTTQIGEWILTLTRNARDPGKPHITMWRGTQYLANHNWFHHAAVSAAALTLWQEPNLSATPSELQTWLDDAVENYFIVAKVHPKDGAPIEGFLYQDYGNRPFFYFMLMADQLLNLHFPLSESDAVKNQPRRVYMSLPDQAGFMVYADSRALTPEVSGADFYRYVADRFQDPLAQAMGDLHERLYPKYKGLWRSVVFYNPEIPSQDLSTLPEYFDFTDFGLYVARSAWTSPDATFFGWRCGPAAGKTVTGIFGPMNSGHMYPNQGDFTFYLGDNAVIPGMDYARSKLTSNHNLVIFEGRDNQAGARIGQVGEGGRWFSAAYNNRLRPAKVISTLHEDSLHLYTGEIGGLYRLEDSRHPDGVFFPEYYRTLVYIEDGIVCVLDNILMPEPRAMHLRLLTGADSSPEKISENEYRFTVGNEVCKFIDLSPGPSPSLTQTKETLHTWGDGEREVFNLHRKGNGRTRFAVVIGRESALKEYRFTTNDQGIKISTVVSGESRFIPWPGPVSQ